MEPTMTDFQLRREMLRDLTTEDKAGPCGSNSSVLGPAWFLWGSEWTRCQVCRLGPLQRSTFCRRPPRD